MGFPWPVKEGSAQGVVYLELVRFLSCCRFRRQKKQPCVAQSHIRKDELPPGAEQSRMKPAILRSDRSRPAASQTILTAAIRFF